MMKNSMFNICIPFDDKYIVYNTFSTSLVELDVFLYRDIFINNKYEEYEETKQLLDMGFLVLDECDELSLLQNARETVIDTAGDKISNIIIAPTLECNAHCYYCFENGFRNGTMTEDIAKKLADYLEAHWNGELLGITWFGGEPLLAVNIIDLICGELKKRKIKFTSKITTNGSLLNKNIAEKAIKLWNVEKVQITIDAIGEEYNRIKNYDKTIVSPFHTVIRNIENALEVGLRVKIRINFDPEKQNIALDIMNYLVRRFRNEVNLKFYFAPIDANNEIVKNIADDFQEYEEHPYISLIKFGRENQLYRGFPDMEDIEENDSLDPVGLLKKLKIYPSPINCYATCPNVYSIAPNGDIYKCHRVLGRKEFASGNICNGIEKNEAYEFFCNTEVSYEECNNCAVIPICQGGCKINARLYGNKEACAPCKAIINDLILLYKEDLCAFQERGGDEDESDQDSF